MPRKPKIKVLEVDGNKLPFVAVRPVMVEAVRLAKSHKAIVKLTYNNIVLTLDQFSDPDHLVKEFYHGNRINL